MPADRAAITPAAGRLGGRGFSLIELLVVLVLVGLMAGVGGPAVARFLDSLEFRKETGRVLAAVRYSRLTAITQGKVLVMSLGLGADGPALVLSGAANETRDLGLTEEARLTLDPDELIFSSEGYATPGRITLKSAGRSVVIDIDPMTGLPLQEGAEE